jgi:hypothetical protein
MDPVVRDEWTRRLRSGDYVQGTGSLRRVVDDQVRYCCLGVLCEVARDRGVVELVSDEDSYRDGYRSVELPAEGAYNGVLPPSVARWARLVASDDVTARRGVDPEVRGTSLSTWNDLGPVGYRRASFARLADLIEEHL